MLSSTVFIAALVSSSIAAVRRPNYTARMRLRERVQPQGSPSGTTATLQLGEPCSDSSQCIRGTCYGVSSMTIPTCVCVQAIHTNTASRIHRVRFKRPAKAIKTVLQTPARMCVLQVSGKKARLIFVLCVGLMFWVSGPFAMAHQLDVYLYFPFQLSCCLRCVLESVSEVQHRLSRFVRCHALSNGVKCVCGCGCVACGIAWIASNAAGDSTYTCGTDYQTCIAALPSQNSTPASTTAPTTAPTTTSLPSSNDGTAREQAFAQCNSAFQSAFPSLPLLSFLDF